ncbi:hypothetical protein XELAEV_18015733mg [Xenopus laevis]|uniref:Uncharacterized protein n=1 Tax=Xenopus laevis TaxID=8355 RepID=A0A974HW75_XENLA|nr:hypothetical protein XELAEV_18015733mg [Xenopus laevis]
MEIREHACFFSVTNIPFTNVNQINYTLGEVTKYSLGEYRHICMSGSLVGGKHGGSRINMLCYLRGERQLCNGYVRCLLLCEVVLECLDGALAGLALLDHSGYTERAA